MKSILIDIMKADDMESKKNTMPAHKLGLLVVLFLALSCMDNSELPAQNLVLDNLGYLPDAPKIAFLKGPASQADSFVVVDSQSSQIAFKNQIDTNFTKDPVTGDIVHVLDFTELKRSGTYQIKVSGKEKNVRTVEFRISEDVYNSVFQKTAESFYYQRCGTEIDNGTQWRHSVCHLDDAVFFGNPEKSKEVTGGWHDAGDYGKYSVNTAVSLSFLLYLYDHNSRFFTDDQLNIPESTNGVPDILDEAKWALTWLRKMQRADGAVYHKVQKKKWTGEYLPQNDPDKRYIYEVSSTATADVAAVAALGARLFKTVDSEFSESLRVAAEKAWKFLEKQPDMVPEQGFKNPEGVKGGEYSDHQDSDERLWAAVELYRLTEEKKYHDYFLKHYTKFNGPKSPPVSWKNVASLAYYSYLNISKLGQDLEPRKYLIQKMVQHADDLVRRAAQHRYSTALNKDEYYWGSNSVVLGYAFDLVQAYRITGNELYKEAALDQLHYILGRNPFGLTYVTGGQGKHSVQNPYHQLSMKLKGKMPVPGMVVGGPNNHNQLHDDPLSEYPAKNYEDNEKNYMVNEVAINYTAPLVYLSGYFSDLESNSISSNSQE